MFSFHFFHFFFFINLLFLRELSEEDKKNIARTLTTIDQEVQYVRSLLAGTIRKRKKKPKIRMWIINNMLLFTVIWQLFLVIVVGLCEWLFSNEDAVLYTAIVLGSFIQFVQLVFIIITSIKLVKQLRHRTASGWFLVQSYLSVIILFSGIYTLIFQINDDLFYSTTLTTDESKPASIFTIYTVFLYFSGTSMSTGMLD